MKSRADVFQRVRREGYQMANIIAPDSYVAKDCPLGTNNIVMPGTVIEPGTKIGDNNVFWSNTTICHDTTIGDHCFFASNATIVAAKLISETEISSASLRPCSITAISATTT